MRHRIVLVLSFLLFANAASAAITGIVMTTDGAPVAGAKVSAYAFESAEARRLRVLGSAADPAPLVSATTDAKGAFKLESPKEPIVTVDIVASGFEPASRSAERDDEIGAIALRRAEMKSGIVRSGGKPVAGAKVIWSYGGAEIAATTDAEGRYSAPDPKNANHVVVVHPDYAIVDEPMTAGRSAGSPSLDRTLVSGRAYTGRVVAADGQTPVANAAVSVDGWPLATSGEDGSFTIAHVSPKWQSMQARSGSLIGFRTNSSTGTTIRLGKASILSGTVRDGKTQAPIAGATINASSAVQGRFDLSSNAVSTDAKGNYSFTLPAGSYRIVVSHPTYDIFMTQASLTAGQSVSKNLSLAQLARISGNVFDDDKQPVSAAVISTEAASGSDDPFSMPMRMIRSFQSVRSGPDGRFTIRVPESEVRVVAGKRGWPTAKSEGIKVVAGERKSGVLITVPRGFAVSGKITDREGRPLSGVAVTSSEATGGPMAGITRVLIGGSRTGDDENVVKTGSDGTFTVRVKEGTYDFTFRREGYASKVMRNVRAGGETQPIETSLDPSVDVTGRVVRNGAGIEGANVFAMATNVSTAVTGPDGTFTLTDLAPGSVRVEISKADEFVRESRNVTAPARDILIELPPGGRISGRVIDKATRQPLTSFQAGISTSRSGGGMMMVSSPQMRAFTSDDGTFVLENVTVGAVTLLGSAPGYVTARIPNLNVEEGKAITDVVLELDTGSKLTGRVTGPNGTPLANAMVRPAMTGGGRMGPAMPGAENSATTEANGEYTIEALEPGEKQFDISHADYLPARKTIEISGRETRMDVQLSAGQKLSGVVVTDAGVPVVDAQVRASSASGSSSSTRSGGGGVFTFDKLAPGRYNFTASKAGLADGVVRDFDIAGGGQVRISMSAGAILTGRVTGLTESELASAVVNARGGTASASAPVDTQGNYRIEGAPTGTVRVTANLMRSMSGSRATSPKTIELAAGDTRTLDLEFRNDTTITGRVTRNGEPLTNGVVAFFPKSGGTVQGRNSASSPTDERGVYTINGLDDGDYNVQVMDLRRLSPFMTQFQVRGSGTFDIDMKGATLRGRVTDSESGQPVADATVNLRAATAESFMGQRTIATDASGSFTMDSVAPGRYSATAEKQGYGNQVLDINVTDAGAPDLNFKIAKNDGVSLRVIDARDGRLLKAIATVTDLQGRVVSEDFMRFGDAAADELKLSLAPGSYRATVGAQGYASQTINITSPGRQNVGLTPGGTLAIRSKASTPRRMRLMMQNGQPYMRVGMRVPYYVIDIGTTTLSNIAPGTYTVQFLGANDVVEDSVQAIVVEGQTMTVDG